MTTPSSPSSRAPLLLATSNAGKVREFSRLLDGYRLTTPTDLNLQVSVEETGRTFCDNAALKATAFAEASGLIALADDSGLEVDALDGAPGTRSARYGGPDLDDLGRCRLLLRELEAVGERERTARFRCCVVAASADGRTCRAEGICEGGIAFEPAGHGGFGYDPIFVVPEYGQTMAQLPAAVKNQLSHRARAARHLRELLATAFPELADTGTGV